MSGTKSTLVEVTFEQLFKEGRLPSGNTFELNDDTVDVAIRVAEVNEQRKWAEKANQAFIVTKRVNGIELHGENGTGIEFMYNMLDTDILFLSLAWSAQMNGMDIDLEEGVPCPSCGREFTSVPFGNAVFFARQEPVGGPNAVFPVDGIDKTHLPKTLRDSSIFVVDPTWKAARSNVSERSWDNTEVVLIYRALSAVRCSSSGGGIRAPSMNGELKQIRPRALRPIVETLNSHVPYFKASLDLKCTGCKSTAVVPFGQGV